MTDHTEIPADVMEAANWIANDQCGADNQCLIEYDLKRCECRRQISLAILAERERCARIVHKRVGHGYFLDEINGVER